jgi:hypothetical protein
MKSANINYVLPKTFLTCHILLVCAYKFLALMSFNFYTLQLVPSNESQSNNICEISL